MACYHPLKAFPIGLTASGKTKYKVCEWSVSALLVWPDGRFTKCYDFVVPDQLGDSLGFKYVRDFQKIPCGTCKGCRMASSRAWADRCMLECQDHDSNYFLTLTYDEDHIKELLPAVDPDSGSILEDVYSLEKKHLQKFHKDLRADLVYRGKPRIRFFACGEYGDRSLRCHFHDIVFGLELDDLKFYRISESGERVFTSQYLDSIWKRGQVFVGSVTWRSCAYTSRYVMKKVGAHANDFYSRHNLVAPFVVMSRRPGIARNYYDTHPELFDFRSIALKTDDGAHEIFPPRYFKKLLEKDDPARYNDLREMAQLSLDVREESKDKQTDLDMIERLLVEEASLDNALRKLKRKGV